MSRLSIATATVILLVGVEAFCHLKASTSSRSMSIVSMTPPDRPAGSFFHKIPDEKDDDDLREVEIGDFNDEVSELLRQRRKPPRASKPSTINGIPTSKATGFGKTTPTKASTKPYIGIGAPDPVINDPTKPEFDDQGYTLYTDRKTGEKSRVFEALVDYPCDFTLKIVGANEGLFVEEIVAVVAEACEAELGSIVYRTKAMGKWASVTVQAPVKSSEMLYALYEKVDLDPRVKFKF